MKTAESAKPAKPAAPKPARAARKTTAGARVDVPLADPPTAPVKPADWDGDWSLPNAAGLAVRIEVNVHVYINGVKIPC